MDTGISNARRLVRTELNYVHNHAALDSIADSGMKYFRFIATLDKRTSEICRSHDSHVYPISEAKQGQNVPPLHPNCRSTIAGSLRGEGTQKTGTRAARNEQGKTIFVPSGMDYDDWKAVYVDKSETLTDWGKGKKISIIYGQAYRPVVIDRNIEKRVDRSNVKVVSYKVESSYEGGIYVDKDARLKPRKLHDITQLLTKAFSLLGMTNSPNKPAVIITDSLKMPALPGVYNYAENVLFINIGISTLPENAVVAADNPLSTYVHELIHWSDAQRFRRTHQKNTDFISYILWIRAEGKRVLESLEQKGYNINEISQYATVSILRKQYDEFYTEYRTLQVLLKR